jgi:SAM-dependent methyltransferase
MTVQPVSVSEVFDAHAADYQSAVDSSVSFSGLDLAFFTAAKIHRLTHLGVRLPRPLDECDVLDVGCGAGALDALLAPQVWCLSGVDVSAGMIEQARTANPAGVYRVYDGGELPFDSQRFDLVFAACVVHHVVPSQWSSFLAELYRVVRPGGAAVVIEHNPLNPLTRRSVADCEFDGDAVLTRPKPLMRVFRELGAERVRCRYMLFTPLAGPRVQTAERRMLSWNPMGAQYLVEAFRPTLDLRS